MDNNKGKTKQLVFDGYLKKCEKCGKITDHAVVGVYEKNKTLWVLNTLKLVKIYTLCKECHTLTETTEEEIKKNALPLVFQKLKRGGV